MKLKRGSQTVEIPVWLIVVLVAAVIVIFMQTGAFAEVRKHIPFFRDCLTDVKGQCHAISDCNQLTTNAYMNSMAKCKEKNQICCVQDRTSPLYTPPVDDPKCSAEGASCGTNMLCIKDQLDGNLKCESKCIYCANNPNDSKCTVSTSIIFGKSITKMDSSFSCKCTGGTSGQCNSATSDFTCVRNMCPSLNANDPYFMCCNRP